MKLAKNGTQIKMSKSDWVNIGKKAGWIKTAFDNNSILATLKMNPQYAHMLAQMQEVISIVSNNTKSVGQVDPQALVIALELNPDQLSRVASLPSVQEAFKPQQQTPTEQVTPQNPQVQTPIPQTAPVAQQAPVV